MAMEIGLGLFRVFIVGSLVDMVPGVGSEELTAWSAVHVGSRKLTARMTRLTMISKSFVKPILGKFLINNPGCLLGDFVLVVRQELEHFEQGLVIQVTQTSPLGSCSESS